VTVSPSTAQAKTVVEAIVIAVVIGNANVTGFLERMKSQRIKLAA
jgi:hypothetical protein